ncbi:hypothetical protein Ddc_05198 [Ditylenchus destructor]|nr:hypothetical protein Ddc_05198 [Ditylenchus destructor]
MLSAIILFLSVGVLHAQAQMIKQCMCSEMNQCQNMYMESLIPCFDECEKDVTAMGANMDQLKQCINTLRPKFQMLFGCIEDQQMNACAKDQAQLHDVQRRYPETLKMTVMAEVNKMLSKAGQMEEVKDFVTKGRKMRECVHTCVDRRVNDCYEKMSCGLSYPNDNMLIENTRQCAVQKGFNSQSAQEICRCMEKSGVKDLMNVCDKITFE